MSIISLNFIFFIGITFIIYLLCPKKLRWIVLLGASAYFYYQVGIVSFITLFIVAMLTYIAGIIIGNERTNQKQKKIVLIVAIISIVAWLGTIKLLPHYGYSSFWLVYPLGASYISFSLLGYLVDVYWGNDVAEKNFAKFLLFSFLFFKITQGPISKHSKVKESIFHTNGITYEGVCFGIQRIIYGFFKKIVIADRAELFTSTVMADFYSYSGSIIVLATVVAAIQLYCDFSGYMDIMLGAAEMFGITLDENFKQPFFSRSASEFWRRWHITLGVWFKDYVYTPMVMSHTVKKIGKWGRKTVGKKFGNSLMKVIALTAVWLLTGIWHGTGMNYIIWGIYWGTIIVLSTLLEDQFACLLKKMHINSEKKYWHIFQTIRTFTFFCIGLLITKLNSWDEAKFVVGDTLRHFELKKLFDGSIYELGLERYNWFLLWAAILCVLSISFLQTKKSVRKMISEQIGFVRWAIYALSIIVILFFGIYGTGYSTAGFAYANF